MIFAEMEGKSGSSGHAELRIASTKEKKREKEKEGRKEGKRRRKQSGGREKFVTAKRNGGL